MPLFGFAASAGAQGLFRAPAGTAPGVTPPQLANVAYDQHLGAELPISTPVRDHQGSTRALGDILGGKPAIVAFVYYECPMLCGQVTAGLEQGIDDAGLVPGRDVEVVLVSFDARETPQQAGLARQRAMKRAPAAHPENWRWLTADRAGVAALTSAAGFRATWDQRSQQWAHPAGVFVVTPDGRIARYLFGIDFPARDLRLAAVEASGGTIGSVADALLLYCFHYDPQAGAYTTSVMTLLRGGAVATVLLLAVVVGGSLRRERRRHLAVTER